MSHGPETRAAVRSAFVFDKMSLDAAAQRFNVGAASAARWKREAKEAGDDWDKCRAAARLAGPGADSVSREVLEEFVTLFQATINQLKNSADVPALEKAEALSRLSDAYLKTMRAVAATNPKLNKLAIGMEVIQCLSAFVRDQYPQHAAAFLEILEPFGRKVSEAFG